MSSSYRQRRIVIDDDSDDDSSDNDWMGPSTQESFVERTRRELLEDSDNESIDDDKEVLKKPLRSTKTKQDTSFSSLESECMIVDSPQHLKPGQIASTLAAESPEKSVTNLEGKTPIGPHPAALEDDAWYHDEVVDEYYLSDKKYSIPGITWPALRLPAELYYRLFAHQKSGIQWMASMHSQKVGGILADDMGMGKTYQSLSYLGGLMRGKTISNALIIVPVSLLRSWENEAFMIIKKKCVPNIQISVVSSDMSRDRRIRILREAIQCNYNNPSLVITTYGLIGGDYSMDFRAEGYPWDYVILDEGHKIKNTSTKVAKNCRYICNDESTRRILLTGTPIMNNLIELWALFDWCSSGKVLGSIKQFQQAFGKPIENGRQRNADKCMLLLAEKANTELKNVLRPYFLQRMKTVLGKQLPRKQEFVVWTHLSPKQRQLYEEYVSGEHVASVLAGEVTSPLEAVTWLKKLCGHPLLVEFSAANIQGEIGKVEITDLLNNSAKLVVLSTLINHLSTDGHRTLIFSQSTKTLDIIERVLEGVNLSRIDGSTKEKDRQRFVDEFNSPLSTVEAMLVSTKAGGLGLTLTGADRAIIFDPSWNPAEDSQAVDRCYRIGQEREVQVFRLIASGTVEEKMYEKQIYKDGIRRAVVTSSGNSTARFFDRQELSKLFKLAPVGECEVLKKLGVVDSTVRSGPLLSHPGVVGVSSHDNVFENSMKAAESSEDPPFSGTPAKRVLGRSQRVLLSTVAGINKIRAPIVAKGKENVAFNDDISAKIDSIVLHDEVASMLQNAQLMIDHGDKFEAMEMLMNIMECHNPQRADKIAMHRMIANLADTLGWMDLS